LESSRKQLFWSKKIPGKGNFGDTMKAQGREEI
jgi:hypothetical protein